MKTQIELNKLLRQEVNSENPNESRIRELVEQRADLNAIEDGESLLQDLLFSYENLDDLKLIEFLIDLGADVNYRDKDGGSVLLDACMTHYSEPVKLILEKGADPNFLIDGYRTPLEWAMMDKGYHKLEFCNDVNSLDWQYYENLKVIIDLLEQYGAKTKDELEKT
ncbi:MAG: ankyrin repeat domain-containing protein [Lentisphaerota bacterium]